MRTTEVVVRNKDGIHGRPAAIFMKLASTYRTTSIQLENVTKGIAAVDAKSMIALMKAMARKGDTVRIIAEGEQEDEAVEAIEAAITSGLGDKLED